MLAAEAPDVPAVTVSGAITEETAVATITAGAVDYVLKDNLTRLAPAARRAVEGAQLRRQEQRAAEQARQTMYAIEHSSQAILYVSEGGVILYVNAAAQRLGGVPPAEAVGQPIWRWSPTVDEQRWGEAWRAAAQHPIVDFEVKMRLPGGEERLISATLDHHERDEGSFVIVYARDITEQREVEERAAESEALYRRIVEMASEGIWAVDDRYVTTFVNLQLAHTLGYEPDEMMGRMDGDFMFEEDKAEQEAQRQAREKGLPGVYERRLKSKDGSEVWMHVSSVAESGPEGEFLGSFALCTDINERKRAEEALRESEERLRFLIDQTPTVNWTMDRDLRFTLSRGGGLEALGVEPDEVLGMYVGDYLGGSGSQADLGVAMHQRALAGESFVYQQPVGDLVFDIILSPLRDAAGEIDGVIGVAYDITERKQAQDALRESEEQFRRFAEYLPGRLTIKDAELRYVFGNDERAAEPSLPSAGWIGKTPEELWTPEEALAVREIGERVLAGEVVEEVSEVSSEHGMEYLRSVHFPIARGAETVLVGGISLDVTEQVKAQKEVRRQAEQLRRTVEGAVLAMSHVVETRDPYTAGHERGVAELATAIAADMGMDGEALEALRLGGLIHDIGKIAVPAEILAKPGRLSEVEFNLIKQHPATGFDILGAIDFGRPVAEMVLQHHERLDGSGYPRALTGKDILPEARILAVADVVEAMSSHRPYRAALGMEAALAEVREHAGVEYDAEVVASCARLVEEQGFQFTP